MNTQHLSQMTSELPENPRNNRLWLAVSLAAIALAVYLVAMANSGDGAPAAQQGAVAGAEAPAAIRLDPAAQSVSDYLRAHQNDLPVRSPVVVLDPAYQGVMGYLQAHSGDTATQSPAAILDPAAQSVADYLRAHSNDRPLATSIDPAFQSVLDYIEAHGG
jgi:hypothetical protein